MGRRERRALERMTRGRRPDTLGDAAKGWFLRYPADDGQPSLKPAIVRAMQIVGALAVFAVAGSAWRRRRSAD